MSPAAIVERSTYAPCPTSVFHAASTSWQQSRVFVGLGGQGFEGRPVEPLVERAARLLHVAHHSIIELGTESLDRAVQVLEAVKSMVSQDREDPALCDQNRRGFRTRAGIMQVP